MKVLFLLVLIQLLFALPKALATCSSYNCSRNHASQLTCNGFESWSEVNDAVNSIINCSSLPYPIYLKPDEPILLTNELNITLISLLNPMSINMSLLWYFEGLLGVNIYPWPVLNFPRSTTYTFFFIFSSIEFYVNNTHSRGFACDSGIMPNDSSSNIISIFSEYVDCLVFGYENTNDRSVQEICPYLFMNARIPEGLVLLSQVDSFLFVSLFRFSQTNGTKTKS
jgi:hypothetical protein